MAGDWIKMRIDLQSHPKIVRILSATKSDKFRVIGGLHAVWSVFDTHSTDGTLPGYTPEAMDHVIGWPGFSDAMIAVNWLSWDGAETLAMPEFGEHNGKSAKRRAEDQKRKRDDRKSEDCPQSVRNLSADEAEKCPSESGLEKRREEKKDQNLESSLRSDSSDSALPESSPADPEPTPKADAKAERLTQVTKDAIRAYNAAMVDLSRVVIDNPPTKTRLAEVKRCIQVARAICSRAYDSPQIVPEFWSDYFANCAADPFLNGTGPYGNGHENWRPDFEYLTRPNVIEEMFDRLESRQVAA